MRRIFVVGSINMDLSITTPRLPALGETVSGSGFTALQGGKGANQAVAAARLGCSVKLLGGVGSDVFGRQLRQSLEGFGVDTEAVALYPGSSGIAVITVCGGDNHIILDAGANDCVSPQQLTEHAALFEWADAVLLQFELPEQTVYTAAQLAQAHGCYTVVNPAPYRPFDDSLLDMASLYIPNQSEAASILGRAVKSRSDAVAVIERLKARCPALDVVVTLGADGCVYDISGQQGAQDCIPVSVTDTTAAGDCFIAALVCALGDMPVKDAVLYATAAAALTVTRRGASASLPDRDAVHAFMQAHVH